MVTGVNPKAWIALLPCGSNGLGVFLEWGLVQRLQAHVHCKCKPMLDASETATLRNDLQAFLLTQGLSADNNITTGQPLALGLMEACQQVCGDVDTKLTQQLAEGVPTGVVNTIPASSVWQQVDVAGRPELSLLVWDEPWQSGSDDPKTLLGLVPADVDDGFAEWLSGGLAEARERFGELCAAGKLGLVHREGAARRLIGDSSVSNANALCRIEERVELPGLRDGCFSVTLSRAKLVSVQSGHLQGPQAC